ncbi:hypothetical protein E2C01_055812 [Portunus trituberculatus]|uniref:Fibronectin type-II domain-containing protein n=1 Tax=Portunus trituberculatus TaxID=210409 RepID=A0A5B7GWZ7_PORTR|nr:hypothetical protein [Portunus trituberculatus]
MLGISLGIPNTSMTVPQVTHRHPLVTDNDNKIQCTFPFYYNGRNYNQCTAVHSSFTWCAVKTNQYYEPMMIAACTKGLLFWCVMCSSYVSHPQHTTQVSHPMTYHHSLLSLNRFRRHEEKQKSSSHQTRRQQHSPASPISPPRVR